MITTRHGRHLAEPRRHFTFTVGIVPKTAQLTAHRHYSRMKASALHQDNRVNARRHIALPLAVRAEANQVPSLGDGNGVPLSCRYQDSALRKPRHLTLMVAVEAAAQKISTIREAHHVRIANSDGDTRRSPHLFVMKNRWPAKTVHEH